MHIHTSAGVPVGYCRGTGTSGSVSTRWARPSRWACWRSAAAPLGTAVPGAPSCSHARRSSAPPNTGGGGGHEHPLLPCSPLQDIGLLRGFCARINHPCVAPSHLHCPHYCNTMANYTTPPRPPLCMPCTIQYWGWQYRVKANAPLGTDAQGAPSCCRAQRSSGPPNSGGGVRREAGHTHTAAEQTTHTNTERATAQRGQGVNTLMLPCAAIQLAT